jgi:hypothetical protein
MGIFLFSAVSRPALGPIQPPIQWYWRLFPQGLPLGKEEGCEADHSSPSAEVNKAWLYTFTPQYTFMAWCLVKYRDNFTFTLPICVCVGIYTSNNV